MESMAYWPTDEKLAAEAMARIAPDIAALPVAELAQVNLDVQEATGMILEVLPQVMALRSWVAMELPAFDISQIDKLEDYTLALRFADATYQTAVAPAAALKELSAQALQIRERLVADVTALTLADLLDPRKLQALKGSRSFTSIAQDLQLLTQILREGWPRIRSKSAITPEDLGAALRVGARLTRIAALREQSPAQELALLDQRQRVFTLTIRAYEEARAAIGYVRRRHGDAASITPNLYAGQARYRSSRESTKNNAPRGDQPSPEKSQPIPAGADRFRCSRIETSRRAARGDSPSRTSAT